MQQKPLVDAPPPSEHTVKKKAIFCEPSISTLLSLRLNLMQALQARGLEVVAAAPEAEDHGRFAELGIRYVQFPASQVGLNPLTELWTIFFLWRLFRRERPDLVHQSTQKLVLYCSLAARLAGVPAKAGIGVEAEGNLTFGPGGRVAQFMGSLVLQTGARTSKFVPYIALGAGFLRASTSFPQATSDALAELGIHPQPTTETAPFVQFGGGLRFYVRPKMAFRMDVRLAQVALDLDGVSFGDSLFAMRRVAGMISWDF